MNKNELIEQLIALLSDFQFHSECISELQTLLQKDLSGKEKQFFKSLNVQLTYIYSYRRSCDQLKTIEKLRGFHQHFYSAHVVSKQYNIRILFSFNESDEPVFLCAFNEREGKRATDYSRYTDVIESRFLEMTGGTQNEQ